MMDKKTRHYVQVDCTDNQLKHLLTHLKMIRVEAVDLDILFTPDDYVNGDMDRGHLNKAGWDKLFGHTPLIKRSIK